MNDSIVRSGTVYNIVFMGSYASPNPHSADFTNTGDFRRNANLEAKYKKVNDNCFDIVVASFVLHMIYKNREVAFKEMIRILKPGGKFAIIEPPGGYKWRINEDLKRKLENFGLKNVKFIPMTVNYPKRRNVYIIYGEKEGKN